MLTNSPATVSPASTTVAAPAATVAVKPAKRVVSAKPAAKPVAVVAKPEAAKPVVNVTRTASTIAANAANFGGLSDRDSAYLTFYASLANGKPVSLRAIVDSGRRPAYNGSNKPHDAGVIIRLGKAGLITTSPDGTSFAFTAKARTLKPYVAGLAKA